MMSETQRAALMAAECAFRRYTHHHITKNDGEKAKANYALADMMAAALAEPEPAEEPVGVVESNSVGSGGFHVRKSAGTPHVPVGTQLYTRQQRRDPLTDEQIESIYRSSLEMVSMMTFARAIEAEHGIGATP